MPKVGTFLFAEDIRDEGGGRYTTVGLYAGDVIFNTSEDARLPKSAILLCLHDVEPGDHEFTIRIRNVLTKKHLTIGSDTATVSDENSNLMLLARIDHMFFEEPGDHRLSVHWDGEMVAEHEFGVHILDFKPDSIVEPKPAKAAKRRKSKGSKKTPDTTTKSEAGE